MKGTHSPSSSSSDPANSTPGPAAPGPPPGSAAPEPAADSGLSPTLRFLLVSAAWLYVAYVLGRYGIYKPLTTPGVDFPKHWLAPLAILEGRNNYIGDQLWLYYNYPQWSALVTFWLGWLDSRTAQVVWKLMNVGITVVSWALIVRFMRPPPGSLALPVNQADPRRRAVAAEAFRHWAPLAAVIIAAFSPATTTVFFTGNIEPWNVLAMTGTIVCLLQGRARLAGVCLAVLCLLKMMPVVLLLPLVLWRRWRVIQGWLLFMFGYFIVLLATNRLQYEWFFVTEMAGKVPFEWKWISVSVPQFFLLYVLPEHWNEDPAIYNRFTTVTVLLSVALYAAVVWAARRRNLNFMLALEPAILLVPFISPLLEGHHLAWALPVLFLQIRRWVAGELTPAFAAAYALGWILVGLDYFYINMMHNFGDWHRFIVTGGGLILVAVSIVETVVRPGKAPAVPVNDAPLPG